MEAIFNQQGQTVGTQFNAGTQAKGGYVEQLLQLFNGATWDGDLIAKSYRDELVKAELAVKVRGYNLITPKGVEYLLDLGLVHS